MRAGERPQCATPGCNRPEAGQRHHLCQRCLPAAHAANPSRPRFSVDPCEEPAHAFGWCTRYLRAWRFGDPTAESLPPPTGPAHRWWTDTEVGYVGAHNRVRALWGSASDYDCASCQLARAEHWACNGTAGSAELTQVVAGVALRYAPAPEFYRPLCRSCHAARDTLARTGHLALVEAAGWFTDRVTAHGGSVAASVLYREIAAAGIGRSTLNQARRRLTDIVSTPVVGRDRSRRVWSLPALVRVEVPERSRHRVSADIADQVLAHLAAHLVGLGSSIGAALGVTAGTVFRAARRLVDEGRMVPRACRTGCGAGGMRPPNGEARGAVNIAGQDAAITTRLNVDTNDTARCDKFRPTLAALVRQVSDADPDGVGEALHQVALQAAALVAAGRVTSTAVLTSPPVTCAARHMSQGAAEAQLLAALRD